MLRPITDAFLERYPDVSVTILLLDRLVNLVDEGVDIAIRIGHLPDSTLVTTRLGGDVRRVVVGSPAYLAKHPPIKEPADLAKHHIVAFSNFGLDAWSFVPAKGSSIPRTVQFAPRCTVNSVRAAGCTYIQFDETSLIKLVDPAIREWMTSRGDDPDRLLQMYVEILQTVIADAPPERRTTRVSSA